MTDMRFPVPPVDGYRLPMLLSTADEGEVMAEGWEAGKSTYDINEFYTRSTDEKGHYKQLRVSVPPEVAARIGQLVQQHTVPQYKTMEAFIRDAIIHRLHWLAHEFVDTEVQREVERQARITLAANMRADVEANVQHVEQLTEDVRLCIQQQDWSTLYHWYRMESNQLSDYREPYRSRIREQLQKAFDAIPRDIFSLLSDPELAVDDL